MFQQFFPPFTVAEYQLLIRAGIITEGDEVELLEGLVVQKAKKDPSHAAALELLNEIIRPRLPSEWMIRIGCTIETSDSVPEPDFVVVRGYARSRIDRHPRPGEIALIVEIARSYLAHNRGVKSRVYARAEIPAFWIVNTLDQTIEVCTSPHDTESAPIFQSRRVAHRGESVSLTIDGIDLGEISVDDLLP